MNSLQNMHAPTIKSVPNGVYRPFWSVMIPTYNCANYLVQTLESVLAQDPGSEHMQIEVIDDCSTKDDPEAVVRKIGKGRVLFYRQPQNVGATRNFNTCIERSCGQAIHILHGDDYVAPNFYSSFEFLVNNNPDTGLFICRVFQVNEKGEIDNLSPRLFSIESPSSIPGHLYYANDIRTPGAVMRRSFYENYGGFTEGLKHTADWELWIRGIKRSQALAINQPLAYYRVFEGNDTNKLQKSGDNLRDYLLLSTILSDNFFDFDETMFLQNVKSLALNQGKMFVDRKDGNAARSNTLLWWDLLSLKEKIVQLISIVVKRDRTKLKMVWHLIVNSN